MKSKLPLGVITSFFLCLLASSAAAAPPTTREAGDARPPAANAADYTIKDFHFRTGETLPELRIHYHTLGEPRRDASGVVRNAVLILHGTTGSGASLLVPVFTDELFGKGQPLDATRYYLILPDGIGHGHSSKPSDGLHARFPRYAYADMIEAQYRLLTEGLKVNHLRLVMGTSMGGMQAWLWGETYPDFMDALMPLASLPTQISGRNRWWRKMISEAIRTDPDWKDGDYTTQPHSLRLAGEMLLFMGSNPRRQYERAPTLEKADKVLEEAAEDAIRHKDANDVLYAVESSRDYDPGPGLEKIRVPLTAVNSADDLINPPDQGILEREIKRVKRGKAIVLPESDQTFGHGTHTHAAAWKQYLVELLGESESR
jgi:homoserine O-acetyltransferase